MQTSRLLELYKADLESDPLIALSIQADLDVNGAARASPQIKHAVREVVTILSQDEPPEDFLATLYSWLLKHHFVDEKFDANKSALLDRFAVVVSYDALYGAIKGTLPQFQDQQLAETIDFVLRNMFPDAVNDALRRDLSNTSHPVTSTTLAPEWKKAIQHGWAFADAPPSTKAFLAMQSAFRPEKQQVVAAAGQPPTMTLLQKLRARLQVSNAPPVATWSQICVRIYELTPRLFLVNYLKDFGCHPPGLKKPVVQNASANVSYFSLPNTNSIQDEDGSLIPKRVLFEMFRMVKTRDVWTKADLSFLGFTFGQSASLDTIERKFVRLADKYDRVYPTVGAAWSNPLTTAETHDIDDILETGQAAAALLSDQRHRSAEETLALEKVEKWLNDRFFLRSWLTGTGVIALEKIKDSTVERLKALYLYYSTCHDGWSQLHAFLDLTKLRAWTKEQGHKLSAVDDPSMVAQKHCLSKTAERAAVKDGVLRSPQNEQRAELLFDAINWHYMPPEDDMAYLDDERLARLFVLLHPGQKRLSRKAMLDTVWKTLDSADTSVFKRVARARLAPVAFDKPDPNDEPDFKLQIAKVNKERARFFQLAANQDKILQLRDVAKQLSLTVSNELTPVERGKSIILQYSRMMEVYGSKAFRTKLSAESDEEWHNARLEYFRTQRFIP